MLWCKNNENQSNRKSHTWAPLKVVTNEKQGGPGSWQMIDFGPRPW
jgi:hypothetical protein